MVGTKTEYGIPRSGPEKHVARERDASVQSVLVGA